MAIYQMNGGIRIEYQALAIGLADELFRDLKRLIVSCNLRFTASFTVANQFFTSYHPL